MRVAPNGGPRDTVIPLVVAVQPPTSTTSFDGSSVNIYFNRYVDRSVLSSVVVQPSVRFQTSYDGDEISVTFTETLAQNTTYSITIGTNWSDVRGNKPSQAFTMVFSTGLQIDSGSIGGRVHARAMESVVVFCQPMLDDTTYNPRVTPAMYRLPVGTSGEFRFEGLRDGRFRVLAVRDANRNGLADVSEDVGTALADLVVVNGVAPNVSIQLGTARDRVPPAPTRAKALNSQIVAIAFTERIDSSRVGAADVTLRDSAGTAVAIDNVWIASNKPETLVVRTALPMAFQQYSVAVRASAIRDSAGLVLADTTQPLMFIGVATPYVYRTAVSAVNIADNARRVPVDRAFVIALAEALRDAASIQSTLVQAQDTIPTSAYLHTPTEIHVKPDRILAPSAWYELRVAIAEDTVLQRSFQTAERADPGGFSAVIIDSAKLATTYVLRVKDEAGKVVRSRVVRNADTIVVEQLPAAAYTLDAIVDANGNGVLDAGDIEPWTFGERLLEVGARIQVRPRWMVEGIRIVVTK